MVMKIRVTVNENYFVTSEVIGKGHLGAHINLDDKSGSGQPKAYIHVGGYETNDPEETRYFEWPSMVLDEGATLKIEIMPNAQADYPSKTRSSLKDKTVITATAEQAERILKVAYNCNELLNELLCELKNELSESDYKKLAYGVGSIINEVFSSVAEPIYRKHPNKRPDEFKDMPL
jgi:hypothetical protein